MSLPRLLHVKVQHNLAVSTSRQLHKNTQSLKNLRDFCKNISFSSDLYEILRKEKNSCLCYRLKTYH